MTTTLSTTYEAWQRRGDTCPYVKSAHFHDLKAFLIEAIKYQIKHGGQTVRVEAYEDPKWIDALDINIVDGQPLMIYHAGDNWAVETLAKDLAALLK